MANICGTGKAGLSFPVVTYRGKVGTLLRKVISFNWFESTKTLLFIKGTIHASIEKNSRKYRFPV
jgi:hypothetical protein